MAMYSTPNGLSTGMTDGSGTINPAALASSVDSSRRSALKLSGLLSSLVAMKSTDKVKQGKGALANAPSDQNQRNLKRSRSPETYGEVPTNDGEDDKQPRKRGRPMKARGSAAAVTESPSQPALPLSHGGNPHTPQTHSAATPHQVNTVTPTQASPPKSTPTKSVIKALPTVRDHTTDQLSSEGDEYIPREYDDSGEKKIAPTGHLLDGRDYRCRTFFVPNRGDKLFMLATECARVLGYRDSYLLFNKNRSLYKIIATQAEKEDLIHQEILPFSYRSRQIAIVTAKSMFRQFGSRVVVNGRRVRDDYWEQKARKQGFTEEDLAGEKRPGAAKARDAAAAEANASANAILNHHSDIVYSNSPAHFNSHTPQSVQPGMLGSGSATTLPMIIAPEQNDLRLRDFSNIQRPRQEITGPAYQDRTQTSPPTELLTHAHNTADYNKQLAQQRNMRGKYMGEVWRQPHEPPPALAAPPASSAPEHHPPASQPIQSPHSTSSTMSHTMTSHQAPQHMVGTPSYTQPPHQQNPLAQSPVRGGVGQSSMRSDQMHGRSPSLPLGSSGMGHSGGAPYNYGSQSQMWPHPQHQQSPQHNFPNYGSHAPQHSPQQHQAPPQQRHSGSNPQLQSGMQYPGMQGMGQGYPAPSRGLYQQDPNSQSYMQATTAGSQPSTQGWAPQPSPSAPGSWNWGNQG